MTCGAGQPPAAEVEQLAAAERMLAAIATAKDARQVADQAAAITELARRARLGVAIVNHATTVRVRAERPARLRSPPRLTGNEKGESWPEFGAGSGC